MKHLPLFLVFLFPLVADEPSLSKEMEVSQKPLGIVLPGEVRGEEVPYCVHFDPAKWEITKELSNPAAEFALKRKGEALYAFLIPETTPVPLEMMPEVIVYNAASKGMKDVKVLQKEIRNIEGKEVLFIEWEGIIGDLNTKISYLGLIYSGTEGTVQFYTFTLNNFLDLYRKDMTEILNGFCFTKVI